MNEGNNKLIYIVVVIILVLLGVGGYFLYAGKNENISDKRNELYKQNEKDNTASEENKNYTNQQKNEEQNNSENSQNQTRTQTKEITVIGSEFKFEPDLITVNKGEKIKIIFENTGNYPHNLVISELNIKTKLIKKGENDIIEFIAPESKTYEFICSVPGHKENGMEGELKVK